MWGLCAESGSSAEPPHIPCGPRGRWRSSPPPAAAGLLSMIARSGRIAPNRPAITRFRAPGALRSRSISAARVGRLLGGHAEPGPSDHTGAREEEPGRAGSVELWRAPARPDPATPLGAQPRTHPALQAQTGTVPSGPAAVRLSAPPRDLARQNLPASLRCWRAREARVFPRQHQIRQGCPLSSRVLVLAGDASRPSWWTIPGQTTTSKAHWSCSAAHIGCRSAVKLTSYRIKCR